VPSPAANVDVIWDLVGNSGYGQSARAPSLAQAGNIGIFRDTHFGAGTGCYFNLLLPQGTGHASAGLSFMPDQSEIEMQFRDLPWIVGNWHWMNSTAQVFAQDLPNLCSTEALASITGQGQAAELSVAYKGQTAERLLSAPNSFCFRTTRCLITKSFSAACIIRQPTVSHGLSY
jgi:hypothetical protein